MRVSVSQNRNIISSDVNVDVHITVLAYRITKV
jgi:hypothetical protein